MTTTRMLAYVVLATVALAAASARGESGSTAFAQGQALLAKGEFNTALQSFASAARADRNNQEYLQHYAMVRQIVDLRGRMDAEKEPQQWEYTARALRAFYVSKRIYPELLKLDQAIHRRLSSAESAAMLAETQLAMEQNAEAVQTLSALAPEKTTAMTQLLLGIALARGGKADQAKQIAAKVQLPKDAGPSMAYTAARLHAATGDTAKTMDLLKTCFERVLPSQLDGFKSHTKTCPEFAAVASTREFADVMKTESKMPESKCSGGSSCAGCPMRGKCSKSPEKQ